MNTTRLLTVVLVSLLFTTGVAAAAPANGGHDTVRIVDEEVTIDDAVVTVSDTSITGPGLADTHVEDRTYAIDTTVHVDGLDVTFDGTTYVICDVTIHVNDAGVNLQDVTLSDGQ